MTRQIDAGTAQASGRHVGRGRRSRRLVATATLVTIAAIPLAGVAGVPAGAAPQAEPKVTIVKIAPKAFPRLLDRPGSAADVLKITKVPGAVWSVGGKRVTFAGKDTFAIVPAKGDVTVTVAPVAPTAKSAFELSGPTSWSFAPTSTPVSYSAFDIAAMLTWTDLPGSSNDTVVLPKMPGLAWKIGTTTYDEAAFTKKDALAVKLTPGQRVLPVLLGATPDAAPTSLRAVTDAGVITYTAAQLAAAVQVGDNPFDATKGTGKKASVETVRITGLPGLQWNVGSAAKPITVKPGAVAYVPVRRAWLAKSSIVAVTPVAGAGASVPKSGTPAVATPVSLDFADVSGVPTLQVPPADSRDSSGTAADVVVFPGVRGMTWFAAQPDAKGKLPFKALRVGPDGTAVYKVKHAKNGSDVTVTYRAVAQPGYRVDDESDHTATFTATARTVARPDLDSDGVTLLASDSGVARWTVTSDVGEKSVKATYTLADLAATGAVSMTVPATAVELKLVRGYQLEP